ncbi:hypothetical protein HYV50_00080 [Candidatus Pacearchaeota archaeon]|nr:hypothetical protein [Candidatus Pacearchaeota archaeon]
MLEYIGQNRRIKEQVNLKTSDMLPYLGLKNYLKRNREEDIFDNYNPDQVFQAWAITGGLILWNISYATTTILGVVKSLETLFQ